MTMRLKITCDCCRNAELFGKPHLSVSFHPRHKTAARDLHFCGTGCLMRFGTNLQSHESEGIAFASSSSPAAKAAGAESEPIFPEKRDV